MSEIEAGASYVVGFMFSPSEQAVLLLRTGKLNGIGGRIEAGETPQQAMRRECIEEVGLDCDSWKEFCVLSDGRGSKIHFLSTIGPIMNASAMTDEQPEVVQVHVLPFDVIANLKWLIPMALTMKFERIDYFQIQERLQ